MKDEDKPIIIPPVEPDADLIETLKRIGADFNVVTIPPMPFDDMQDKIEELASTKTLTIIKNRQAVPYSETLKLVWAPLNKLDETE